jgi:hypothetical protein
LISGGAEWRRDQRHRRRRRRDGAEAQPSHEAVARLVQILLQGVAISEDAVRPFEHALSLRRQPLEALAGSTMGTPRSSSSYRIAADSIG